MVAKSLKVNCEEYFFSKDSKLEDFSTSDTQGIEESKQVRKKTRDNLKQIAELQEQLFAERKQSILFVLQAMDAAGKDSSIRKLSSRLNSANCLVHSFKKPTKEELAHDFLWRVHKRAPEKGYITFFNRSHYEEVLVVKVHKLVSAADIKKRYGLINEFEQLLASSGTRVVKVMLNVSQEYQLGRFKKRLENPGKWWKFNPGDLDERKLWTSYMSAFEQALQKCSSKEAPWYVVPAENRWYRDLVLSELLLENLKAMAPEYPEASFNIDDFPPESLV